MKHKPHHPETLFLMMKRHKNKNINIVKNKKIGMKKKLKNWINSLFLWMGYIPVTRPSNEVIYSQYEVNFQKLQCDFMVNIQDAQNHYLGEVGVYKLHMDKAISDLMESVKDFIEVEQTEVQQMIGRFKKVRLSVYVGKSKTT